jgi:hypothetical protein
MFEAITGRLPFTVMAPARINFLSRQSGLAMLRLRDLLPEAPPELEAFLARCLCDDPEQRFENGADGLRHFIPLCGARPARDMPEAAEPSQGTSSRKSGWVRH